MFSYRPNKSSWKNGPYAARVLPDFIDGKEIGYLKPFPLHRCHTDCAINYMLLSRRHPDPEIKLWESDTSLSWPLPQQLKAAHGVSNPTGRKVGIKVSLQESSKLGLIRNICLDVTGLYFRNHSFDLSV